MRNSYIIRKILFKIVIICPFNSVRVFIYRYFFKYKIGKNVFIGKSKIDAQDVHIGDEVDIKHYTLIICQKLHIGNQTTIHSHNKIQGTAAFSIGENSRIINEHTIDLHNDVTIGNNSWLAGKGSQIWTHGSTQTLIGNKDLSVKIGDFVYIGSNSLIAPGVSIANHNLIGLGSVITKSFDTSKNIISGNPATIVKENFDWRENW